MYIVSRRNVKKNEVIFLSYLQLKWINTAEPSVKRAVAGAGFHWTVNKRDGDVQESCELETIRTEHAGEMQTSRQLQFSHKSALNHWAAV